MSDEEFRETVLAQLERVNKQLDGLKAQTEKLNTKLDRVENELRMRISDVKDDTSTIRREMLTDRSIVDNFAEDFRDLDARVEKLEARG